jgi:REP element-mobilizing transposase RayT
VEVAPVSQPLVIAYHLGWTAYGWLLPNDPRGSRSTTIRSDVLAQLGELHQGRKLIQPPADEVRRFYEQAADLLQHPLLTFDEGDVAEIAVAFAQVIEDERYTCYACAIMPDHVHVLLRKHKHQAEQMIEALRTASRAQLCTANRRPADHPVWSGGTGWKVFLDHPDEVRRTIRYIEDNPVRLGLPEQHWPFVKPYDGWPLHPGHSPNSPYARRLRKGGRYP